MTDICERFVVHCPALDAPDYLAAFVADHKRRHGSAQTTLRIPIDALLHRRPMTELSAGASHWPKAIGEPYPAYSVTWLPDGNGTSAEFIGALAVEKVAQDDWFGLILRGHCAAIGPAGAECNTGCRLAKASPRTVLHAIANYVENARAHNEAALAGHSPLTYVSCSRSQRRVDAGLDVHRLSTLEQSELGLWHFMALRQIGTPASRRRSTKNFEPAGAPATS
jgi:hypothetical protein